MSDNQDVPDWVRSIPDSWRLFPVGKLFDERKEYVSDTEFPALSVTKRGVIPQLSDVAKTQNGDSRKLVRSGDFVINSRSDRKGSSGISEQDGSVSVVYTVLRPREELDLNFVHHLLRSSAFQEEFYRWGSGIVADLWSTRYSAMKKIMLPTPPLDEQRAIADYLDRETQKIDELIDEQRGLIEILRERRRAVIDAKSLGGMDPLDPQKNLSWSSSALGYGFEVKLGKMLDSGKVRDDMARNLPYIRAGNIQDSGLDIGNLNSMPFTREEELKFNLECNDLLVVEGGAIGTSVVLEEDLPGVCFQKTVNRLRGTKDWNPRYYRYVLLAYRERGILDILANKSTIAHFTAEKLRGLRVPVPSIREQNEIAADLDRATSRIDDLIAESEDLIALSEERRAALITAAVTGQIDVREAA